MLSPGTTGIPSDLVVRRASRLQRSRQTGGAPVVLPEIGRETSPLGLRPGGALSF